MRAIIIALPFAALFMLSPAAAQTIYPFDRADILAASRFDFKVEFPGLQKADTAAVTINGEPYAKVLGPAGQFVEREDGKDQSALILRDVSLTPGTYKVQAGATTVTWNVYATGPGAERVHGSMDNTEVFRVMVEAIGLGNGE